MFPLKRFRKNKVVLTKGLLTSQTTHNLDDRVRGWSLASEEPKLWVLLPRK